MNNLESIKKALAVFDRYKIPVAILHTTNLYPTPASLVRLGAMQEMAATFPGRVYGLSDHTTSNLACLAAVALGASILERHFTDRMNRKGPDIICSMDEQVASTLIRDSQAVFSMLGGKKEATMEEQVTIDFAYASVVTIKSIKRGEILTTNNIWVKRPGKGGIPAEKYEQLLGKQALVDIDNNIQLKWNMIN